MSGVVVKVTENKLIVTKEDKKVRITAPYVDNHYDATFASDAETLAGTETAKAISPASLEAVKDVEGGLASKDYADAKITQTITKDVTNKAPSEGAVFDALALKADASDVADALALKADVADVMNAPESSVDENIPIFDGIAGNLLKDSGVKLSDKADVTYVEYLMMEGDPA